VNMPKVVPITRPISWIIVFEAIDLMCDIFVGCILLENLG